MKIRNFKADRGTFFTPLWFLLCRHRFKKWNADDIRRYQDKRMKEIIKFAVDNSKFYQKYYQDKNINDSWNLPTVNKKLIIDNLTDVNTLNLTKEEIFGFCLEIEKSRDFSRRYRGLNIGMSSGTSGNKGVEITTPREESYIKTCFLARFPFISGEKLNLAFILRVFTPAFNFNKFGHRVVYVNQMQSIEKIVNQLNDINPNVISGPSSVLRLLAKEIVAGELRVRPKRLISYAEVLSQTDKEFISNIFQAEVHQIYKATEGSIAMTCKAGSLHINEDLVAVELLEKDGTPTPIGQPCSRMVITDLHKTSMPIIRYALNDIVSISPDKCACGSSFRVIKQIQGRADDILWARNRQNNSWVSIFPDFISRAIISACDKIDEYQVIQESAETLVVRIQPQLNEENEKKIVRAVKNVFSNFECLEPHVIIKWEQPVPNERSGKLIRIFRSFSEPV
ncbi:MAG: F390 synthetase-related protein [Patescibacteria group bacterium]